ncbi:MAG: polysaccharide deacetylase family protein [Reichenbachiella sp.]
MIRLLNRQIKWNEEGKQKSIYLTFDDGPDAESTDKLLVLLKELDVKATFFLTGQKTAELPGVVKQIVSHGHRIANHGYLHLNGYETNDQTCVENVVKAQQLLGNGVSKLFRPPYGKATRSQVKALVKLGYTVVNWTLMPGDFDPNVTREVLSKRLLKYKKGDIVVLHDTPSSFDKYKEGLVEMVKKAKSESYGFELL